MRRLLLLLIVSMPVLGEDANFYIVRYSPGPGWVAHVPYREQPGIVAHLNYLLDLYDRGILLMSGPLVDLPGSMVIIRGGSLEAVRQFVDRDPAVLDKLLLGSVSGWKVQLSSLRETRKPVVELEPDKTFTLKRRDQYAPINLPQE